MDKSLSSLSHFHSDYVEVFSTSNRNPEHAISEIADAFLPHQMAFILLFFPADIEPDAVELALQKYMEDLNVYGASSAGQITPNGYEHQAYMAIGFPKAHFRVASYLMENMVEAGLETICDDIAKMAQNFNPTAGYNRLGLIFPDGLSKREDVLIAALASCLPDISIYGGSAAECYASQTSLIFSGGHFRKGAGLFLLIETDMDVKAINFDHFAPTEHKFVVTKAMPNERLVIELNGAKAVEEYARKVGAHVDELGAQSFAQFPFMVKMRDHYPVRSISNITENGALELFASIDEGLILTLGSAHEIVRRLDKEIDLLGEAGESPEFILAFDCFLRRLEIEDKNRVEKASQVLTKHRVFGFNTYGEQIDGMHVYQTFVGIAFFPTQARRVV